MRIHPPKSSSGVLHRSVTKLTNSLGTKPTIPIELLASLIYPGPPRATFEADPNKVDRLRNKRTKSSLSIVKRQLGEKNVPAGQENGSRHRNSGKPDGNQAN